MGDFWATLSQTGVNALGKITAPVSAGLSNTLNNLIIGAQNKVASATNRVVSNTNPIKNANQPAVDGTSAKPAITATGLTAQGNIKVVIAAVLVVVLFYFLSRKT